MIALEGVAARRAPLTLASLTLSWGPGVHAVVGTPADGGPLLLALVAGRAPFARGASACSTAAPGTRGVRAADRLRPAASRRCRRR